jgi:hypothetical protein
MAKRKESFLLLRVFIVREEIKWEIEKGFLAFPPLDLVRSPILVSIPIVPFKSDYIENHLHSELPVTYIDNIYVCE